MTHKVRFLTSHPIQYQAPVFRHLANDPELDFEAWFCQLPDAKTRGDGFGIDIEWDIPILDGYTHRVLNNIASQPSVTAFRGCDTPEVADWLHQDRPDVVIINGWVVKSCLQTLRACRRQKIPTVVRCEANLLRPRPWWKHLLHTRLLKQFSAYGYIGNANRQFYRCRGIDEQHLFFSPYCIDNERFQRALEGHPSRESLRRRWQIRDTEVCFLYSGKFIDKKHPVELTRTFAAASSEFPNMRLLMVGDGELKAECERVASESGAPITFTGFLNQSEIAAAYVASDCLVLPSDHGETWGLVANEAMVCGRAVLASDQVGCVADLVRPGETGEVYSFGDWESLRKQLISMARNPKQLSTMGKNAARIVSGYSPRVAAKGLSDAVGYLTAAPQNAPRIASKSQST